MMHLYVRDIFSKNKSIYNLKTSTQWEGGLLPIRDYIRHITLTYFVTETNTILAVLQFNCRLKFVIFVCRKPTQSRPVKLEISCTVQ